MVKKVIEFVCTANLGRSPLAEALATDHLTKQGLFQYLQARSSGILVNSVRDNSYAPSSDRMQEVISWRANFDPNFLKSIEGIEKLQGDNLLDLYRQSVEYFVENEKRFRIEYFRKCGLEIKGYQEQTIPQENTLGIFTMDLNQKKFIESLYASSGIKTPKVTLLGNGNIPNTFGQSRDFYFRIADSLKVLVPKSLEKLIGGKNE